MWNLENSFPENWYLGGDFLNFEEFFFFFGHFVKKRKKKTHELVGNLAYLNFVYWKIKHFFSPTSYFDLYPGDLYARLKFEKLDGM